MTIAALGADDANPNFFQLETSSPAVVMPALRLGRSANQVVGLLAGIVMDVE
jgi:hypothetical protein